MNDPQIHQSSDTEIKNRDADDPRAEFGIHNPRAISRYLAQSVSNGDLYTVHFRGQQFITCLLEVDAHENILVFDSSQTKEANAALMAATRSRFRGQSGGVSIEFDLSSVRATKFEDRPA
ncbi:MAG TPA: flagellar regulator YcgR PilZN domain-containing protein, partial [Bordetella sp.]|uniref:flagellar regulator YcgR PilZN domain-containing protein n=1 Tax=Bordetella sp. TaxID=28081 RepID=UPI002EFFBAB2